MYTLVPFAQPGSGAKKLRKSITVPSRHSTAVLSRNASAVRMIARPKYCAYTPVGPVGECRLNSVAHNFLEHRANVNGTDYEKSDVFVSVDGSTYSPFASQATISLPWRIPSLSNGPGLRLLSLQRASFLLRLGSPPSALDSLRVRDRIPFLPTDRRN